MIDLFVLIIVSFFLALTIEKQSKGYGSVLIAFRKNVIVKILVIVLLLALILFSGLRTTYNDTSTYMNAYTQVDINVFNKNLFFEPYGGFTIFQILIKKYVSTDPQALIMVSSIIVNVIYVWFLAKHSKCFGLTILGYFIFGPYVFSMAGIKQILAMSICLFAIDNLLKEKYIKFVLWILIAMTFHPYIICLLVLPFFRKEIWNVRIFLLMIGVAIVVSNLEILLNVADLIGKEYTVEEFTNNTINPFRVVIVWIPVVLSFVCRKYLNVKGDKILLLGINMMIINAIMIFIGLYLNPIYFGRIGTYFASFNAITIPTMLGELYKRNIHRKENLLFFYSIFSVYFLLDMTKLGSISIYYDIFNHIKLF